MLIQDLNFILSSPIKLNCLNISYDILDSIFYKEEFEIVKMTSKAYRLYTDDYVFECLVDTLGSLRHPVVKQSLIDLPKEKYILIYFVCLANCLLKIRHDIVCTEVKNWIPWNTNSIVLAISFLKNLSELSAFPSYILEVRKYVCQKATRFLPD